MIKKDQANQVVDNPVVRKLFKMGSLESLDKAKPGKVTLNLMGVERETESDQVEGMTGIVERLGVVLA